MKQRSSLLLGLGMVAAYFCTARLGLSLAVLHPTAPALWPPAGIALAALLVWGLRFWPAVFAASFLVNLNVAGSVPATLAIAAGNTLEAILGAWLIRRFARGVRAFETPRGISRFVLWCIPGVIAGATVGLAGPGLDGSAGWDQLAAIWSTRWLGDFFGLLIVAPFLVAWLIRPLPILSRSRVIEAIELLVAIVLLSQIIFVETLAPGPRSQLKYLTILPLIWASLRFGQRGAMTSVILVASIALWGAMHGVGPFVTADPNECLLLMQTFLGGMTITALLLSAVIAGRQRAEARLRTRDAVSRTLAESATMEEAAPRIVQALCENCGWDMGAVWLVDRAAHELYCVDVWCSDAGRAPGFDSSVRQLRYAEGAGLPGRTWSARTPICVAAEVVDERPTMLIPVGLKSAFCFPIKRGQDVLGVVECFSAQSREPDDDLLELLEYMGMQLGQFIVRTQAEAAHAELLRREREARLSAEAAQVEAERRLDERRQVEEALGRWAREPFVDETRPAIWRYGVPLVCVISFLLARGALGDTLGGELALPTLLGAVAIAMWYGGVGPGLVACVLGYAGANWRSIVEPELWSFGAKEVTAFGVYLGGCLAIIAAGSAMRRSERHARSSARLAVNRQGMVEAEMAAREEAQMSLRTAEAQLRLITERTPLMLTRCSRDLRYLYVNRAGARMFGLTPQEMIGKPIAEIIGTGALATIRPYIDRVLSGQTVGYETEVPYARAGVRTVRVVYVPDTDERGAVVGWVASVDDVTDRYRAEKARRQSEERTRRIVETAMDAVVSVNVQGAITDWNPQAEQIFGWKETEVVGRSLSETIIPARHRRELEAGLERYGKSGASPVPGRRIEVLARRRDGSEIPVELSVTSSITGEQMFFHAFIRDITDRKRAEQQLQDREHIQRLLEEVGLLAARAAEDKAPFEQLLL
ncbi:MAG TPA: PAS domain S-box protein, partial [Terriglobia bacterium]|nr:PAS domain S-box protein [Terriglobia bacterium]